MGGVIFRAYVIRNVIAIFDSTILVKVLILCLIAISISPVLLYGLCELNLEKKNIKVLVQF